MVEVAADALRHGRHVVVLTASHREARRIERLIRGKWSGRTGRLQCIPAENSAKVVRGSAPDDLFVDHRTWDVDTARDGAREAVEVGAWYLYGGPGHSSRQ